MKETSLLVFLIFFSIMCFGQCLIDSSWTKGSNKVQFDGRKNKRESKLQIVFREGFKDSVISCLNGKFLNGSFVVSDSDTLLGFSNFFFNIKMKPGKKNLILFAIPGKKYYTEVNIPKGYKYLDVFKYDNYWILNYRNSIIVYE